MTDREDLAPEIAAFLADNSLNAPMSYLAGRKTEDAARLWLDMFKAFPQATGDELRRGTLIAMELMAARAAEIALETEEFRKRGPK